ncbi:MAG: TlpA family protein disulfide reductase [Sulfuricaulis sp.]
MKKRTAPLLLLAAAATLAWVATLLFVPASSVPPDTQFVLLDGKKISLETLRGRPVLVSFWSITCAPCIAELPDLAQLYQEWHRLGFELVAVAMPDDDPPSLVQAFVQDRHIPYPVALDLDSRVASAFGGVSYIPAAYLIAPDGNIVLSYTGRLDIGKVQRIISKYLKPAAL